MVGERTLWRNVSFSLTKKRYALVGPNGAGKSTLAKIIAKELAPQSGSVQGRGSIKYLPQDTSPEPNTTVAEFLQTLWLSSQVDHQLVQKLISTIDLTKRLTELSGGEWIRVRLAQCLAESPDFLILDEPTNNLDTQARQALYDFLRLYRLGILVISHDRELLQFVDTTLELSNRGLSVYGGNFDFYWQQRQLERENLQRNADVLNREQRKKENERIEKIAHQEKRMRDAKKRIPNDGLPKIILGRRKRQAEASLAKLNVQEKQFVESAQQSAQESIKKLKTDPFLRLDFSSARAPAGKTLVSVQNFNLKFLASSEYLWKKPIDLLVKGSQRWHVHGCNGAGKSTLLKSILHVNSLKLIHREGTIQTAAHMAYLDQRYSLLDPEKSVLDNIFENSRFGLVELRNELAFYGFTGDQVFQPVKTLSGGEILKASLAQIFLARVIPDLILLDEPTNNLDFQSQNLLLSALEKFQGALILISHDTHFVTHLKIDHELNLFEFSR